MADKLTMSSQAVVDENGVSTLAYLRDDDAIHPGQDSGTTMVNFTDDDLDEGITDYPSFVSKVISGITLKKFLRDFVEGASYVLHRGNIANNLTTTEVGSLLDATQGKILNDNKLDKTGDAQNATVGTFTESSASYPVPTAGDTFKVALGKIVKFFADIKTNALSNLSVSGRVITYTKADGATGTITTQDTTYEVATSNSDGLMSSTMVSKLATIEEGANAYTLPTATDEVIGGVSVTEGNGLTNTNGNIAVSAASSTSAGTITSTEHAKLTGIESGAEVNQNAFSNVAVGNTTIASGAKTATLTLASGSNVSLSPDANAKKITISATDTTYDLASTDANGLLRQLPSTNNTTQYLRGDGNWTTVVNNATTSDSGYILDARMGKTLQDQITTLNDSLTHYNLTGGIIMETGVSYTSRYLLLFQRIVIFEMVLPSFTAGYFKIAALPTTACPSMQVSLSVSNELSADRAGHQEAFVNVGGVVYVHRELNCTGKISISGCWYLP